MFGVFFPIFNIWLNKIHLCKQTQDKALTKPNKQENRHGLPRSQAAGLDRLAHPRAQRPPLPRDCGPTPALHLSSWITLFPRPGKGADTQGEESSPKISSNVFAYCALIRWLAVSMQTGFLQSATLIGIESVAVEIYFSPLS